MFSPIPRLSRFSLLMALLVCSGPAFSQQNTASPPTAASPTVPPVIDAKALVLPLDEEATLTRDAKGGLVIAWKADAKTIDIFLVDDPSRVPAIGDAPDHVVVAKKEFAFPGVDEATRKSVVLRFHGGASDGQTLVVGERRLALEGAGNLRDVGGYRTEDGRHVRWGMLYRSEALATLTDRDRRYLTGLKLHTVYDFRGLSEAAAAPDKLPASSAIHAITVPIESGAGRSAPGSTNAAPAKIDYAALAKKGLGVVYIQMVDTHAKDAFGPFITALAGADTLPALYHCTAGKDRTGIATELVLRLLGVPEPTVLADYSMTNLALDALAAQATANPQLAGLNTPQMRPLMLADPKWLEATLRHIDEKYGSVEGYLTTACGVDKATLEMLRARLLQ